MSLKKPVTVNFNGVILVLRPNGKGARFEERRGKVSPDDLVGLIELLLFLLCKRVKEGQVSSLTLLLLANTSLQALASAAQAAGKLIDAKDVSKLAHLLDQCLGQQGQCVTIMPDAKRRTGSGG